MHDKLILRRIEKSGNVYDKRGRQSRALGGSDSAASSDVGDCILLFGAFCNGECAGNAYTLFGCMRSFSGVPGVRYVHSHWISATTYSRTTAQAP